MCVCVGAPGRLRERECVCVFYTCSTTFDGQNKLLQHIKYRFYHLSRVKLLQYQVSPVDQRKCFILCDGEIFLKFNKMWVRFGEGGDRFRVFS